MMAAKSSFAHEYKDSHSVPRNSANDFRYLIRLTEFGLEKAVTIYIGNLSFQATEEDITEVFVEYGAVKRVTLPTDRETGKKRGFAFVELENESDEDSAIEELDGAEWMGREIRLNKARPREPRSSGGFSRPRSDNFS